MKKLLLCALAIALFGCQSTTEKCEKAESDLAYQIRQEAKWMRICLSQYGGRVTEGTNRCMEEYQYSQVRLHEDEVLRYCDTDHPASIRVRIKLRR